MGVSVAPQIPFLNEDMEQVLKAAHAAGARSAFYTVLRLPWELDGLFKEWLQVHYPQRAARVLARVQDLHGLDAAERSAGKSYDSNFATRMKGRGVWAELLAQLSKRFSGAPIAAGLMLFGLFSLVEARYRRIHRPPPAEAVARTVADKVTAKG